MKYLTAITTLVFFNLFAIIALLYFGNNSRIIYEKNEKIKSDIDKLKKQLEINEIEYTVHNNYNYLKKIQKIYLENENLNFRNDSRLSLHDFKKSDLDSFYITVSE